MSTKWLQSMFVTFCHHGAGYSLLDGSAVVAQFVLQHHDGHGLP